METEEKWRWQGRKEKGMEGEEREGREASEKRKSQAEQGETDVYLSEQTKTREDTQGGI